MSKLNKTLKVSIGQSSYADIDKGLLGYSFKGNNLNKLLPKTKKKAIAKGIRLYSIYVKNLEDAARNKTIICLLANKFCTIIYGGLTNKQKREGVYKLKNFADDIGMPPGTLQAWMEAFRNINLVLDEATPEEEDWIFPDSEKRKIIHALKKTDGINSKSSKKDILKAVANYKEMDPMNFKLLRHLENMIGIQHFLVDKNIDKFDKELIKKLTNVLNKCLIHLGGK